MNDIGKDIAIAILVIIGLVGFISGEFIISSTLFAVTTIVSHLKVNRQRAKDGQLSWD
jgi:CheY-specific phosphatase CheX